MSALSLARIIILYNILLAQKMVLHDFIPNFRVQC
jgi:hypothetical protein